ncbi:Myb-like DNA-binding domain containing protein [Trichomonas vaginalis G3]|uniref:Myb-like DNA-binding domain containing protein n=1 Tax=Trichomonas vaginalis (strain ATCC PRA-98 / G3) TaxID=412133 RepID=A2GB74_TRIV3|nr:RNA polymerase II transcription regulator recruiting protein [Trichomonas vaginalis G3]EAX85593.1 Myb-like DNA-binding domain containing protein [Trichomonas vaginalis G3]KAI5486599.1 RNA polymerase II transcription regulator recruiting protein [Trichomonas vaginalis G3]|eukprot:XP_001298523.1 Myb-like DNA-binding domain containing protein [Trichomonas vaginalis G3]
MNGSDQHRDGPPTIEQNTLRKRFSEQEDALLKSLVEDEGIKNWEEISKRMPSRTSRQCRDRYNNYLFKEIINKPWTPEEDRIILEKYMILGPHWVKISEYLDARSGNNVKNRWHKYLSKLKNINQEKPQVIMNPPPVQVHPEPSMSIQPQYQPQPVYDYYQHHPKIPSITELPMAQVPQTISNIPFSIDIFLNQTSHL